MRPVRNVFQKLSRTEQRREGVVAYLWVGVFKFLRPWVELYPEIFFLQYVAAWYTMQIRKKISGYSSTCSIFE